MERRVVITGMGAITPIGNNIEEIWDSLRNGKGGIGKITRFDASDYPVTIAGEIKDFQQISQHGPWSKIPQMARKTPTQTKRLARLGSMNMFFTASGETRGTATGFEKP